MNVFSQQNLNNNREQKKEQNNKIVCVGRNYIDHAKELNNPVPNEPLLFIKPWTTITPLQGDIHIPTSHGEVHHEIEIALTIDSPLKNASEEDAVKAISGIGLALDLTLRDIQTKLKNKGQPWEKAKSFDGACPLHSIPFQASKTDLDSLSLSLHINGKLQQQGHSSDMLFKPLELIAYISHWFTLMPGDIVLTGTPAGVGPLKPGDKLESRLAMAEHELLHIQSEII